MQPHHTPIPAAAATGTATVTVLRQLGNVGTVNVNYATSDGSAISGGDYTSTAGTLTFAPGETSKSFSVPITVDAATVENEEQLNLTLSSVTGTAKLGDQSTATVKIQ